MEERRQLFTWCGVLTHTEDEAQQALPGEEVEKISFRPRVKKSKTVAYWATRLVCWHGLTFFFLQRLDGYEALTH